MTPTMGILHMLAHNLDPVQMFRSFRKWEMAMDINPQDATSYTTQYQEALQKDVEYESCAKHRRVMVNKLETALPRSLVPSATHSGSYRSYFDACNLSSNDEENIKPYNVAESSPGRSDRAACVLLGARPYVNLPPDALPNCGQIDPNLNDCPSNPTETSSTSWIPDITDWRRPQEEPHLSMPISPMLWAAYSISYHMVSECRPVWTLAETLLAWGSQKPPARLFANNSFQGSSLKEHTGFWQAHTQNWIPQIQKTTLKCRNSLRKGHCTEWPRFITFCRCGMAAKPMWDPEGISHSKYADDRHRIQFGPGSDRPRIIVTLSTWWWGSIYIVR